MTLRDLKFHTKIVVWACSLGLGLLPLAVNAQTSQSLSDADLKIHLSANQALLGDRNAGHARRIETALNQLSKLSSGGLSHLLGDSNNLLPTEQVNGLLLQQVAKTLTKRWGVEDQGDGTEELAEKIFTEIKSRGMVPDGPTLHYLLRAELYEDATKAEIIRNYDNDLLKNMVELEKNLPELFNSPLFKFTDPVQEKFVKTLCSEYFKRKPLYEKELILLDIIQSAPRAKKMVFEFGVITRHAGIQLGKIFQALGRRKGTSPELAEFLIKLESAAPEMEFKKIEDYLRESFPEVYPRKLRITREKVLGSGTVAQTYKAVMIAGDGQEIPVALRVIRPGAVERTIEEKQIFEAITPVFEKDPTYKGTPYAGFGRFWRRDAENIAEELDATITLKNQTTFENLMGERAHLAGGAKGLTSDVRITKSYLPELASKGILVQELVEGVKFETFFERHPDAARGAAIDVATLWIREALFISGYHHSDPQLGNFMVSAMDSARPQVYLMDFGMIGKLDEKQRSSLILLDYALTTHDLTKALLHADELLRVVRPAIDPRLVKTFAKEEMRSKIPGAAGLLMKLVGANQDLPRELFSFSRAYVYLDQLLAHVGAPVDMFAITSELGKKLVGQDVMARVVGWGKAPKELGNPTPLSTGDLWKLGGSEASSTCGSAFKRLFGK